MNAATRNCKDLLRRRASDLVRLLDQQREGYEQLFIILDGRIGAMRRGDWAAMQQQQDEHHALAERLADREGLRRQLMDAIGVELQLAPRAGRRLTVSQLAAKLPADLAAEVAQSADRLRLALFQVSQANRLAGHIARGILDHLRWVFEAVTPGRDAGGMYANDGAPAANNGPVLFEITG